MTGYKEVTEVCTTPFIYLDGSMYEVLIRSLVRRSCAAGEKQEAAAAVELTSLFVLVSNALKSERTSLLKPKVVP